jgi:hypothetical protein
MKRAVILLLLALFETSNAGPWQGLAKEKLGGFAPGDTEDSVRDKLGKPPREVPAGRDGSRYVKEWVYPDVTFLFAGPQQGPFTVIDVSTRTKLTTSTGITVGATVADLKKAYGNAVTGAGESRENYVVVGGKIQLLFDMYEDKVFEISFAIRDR